MNEFSSKGAPKTKRRAMGKTMLTPEEIKKQADDLLTQAYHALIKNMDEQTRELLDAHDTFSWISSAAYFSPATLKDPKYQKRALSLLKMSAKSLKGITGGQI